MVDLRAIEAGLASSNNEDVYDAIIDIGKQGARDLAPKVQPFLASTTPFLREAALRTLVFHLELPGYKLDARRMLDGDPDPGAREAAAMGLGRFARHDGEVMQQLLRVALDGAERDTVRAAAFLGALVAAGVSQAELPRQAGVPNFEARADWALLARALRRAEIAVPPALVEKAGT